MLAGIQCTAMAAAAIAMAAIQSPMTWTTCTVDACLLLGHGHFAQQNTFRPTGNQSLPMNTDEIVGTVHGVFGSQSVRIEQIVNAVCGFPVPAGLEDIVTVEASVKQA